MCQNQPNVGLRPEQGEKGIPMCLSTWMVLETKQSRECMYLMGHLRMGCWNSKFSEEVQVLHCGQKLDSGDSRWDVGLIYRQLIFKINTQRVTGVCQQQNDNSSEPIWFPNIGV